MKQKFTIIMLCLILMLTGCGGYRYVGDYVKSNATKIVKAAKKNDDKAIYNMFSEFAKSKNSNIMDDIDKLEDFIKGDIEKITVDYSRELNAPDKKYHYKSMAKAMCIVTTTEDEYYLYLFSYKSAFEDKYVGFNNIGIQTKADHDVECIFLEFYNGVYVVTEDNHEELKKLEAEYEENYEYGE